MWGQVLGFLSPTGETRKAFQAPDVSLAQFWPVSGIWGVK